jgi:hypothetical protein
MLSRQKNEEQKKATPGELDSPGVSKIDPIY